ncbi:cation efflux system protein [Thiomicrorhabdus immobilis]|uniref:Cation efflux system protein n=1 Tax=Thiomicrorhabdus immobilis TaxID=2791037 RepID=A0ABN6CZT2_9GAMM|nr:efflux RND transporter permease subunit [Thiomicrorhabdus immobilis]BCN94458.1 cation efflux system protein [Thiomicrorhabdus immobilis]
MNRFNVSAYAVKERSLTLYFILVVAIAGVYAFLHMGRAEDPTFNVNTMVVSASWPGATALEMQNQVADPLEKKLEEIEYFDRVETKARAGRVDMLITLAEDTPMELTQQLYYQVRKRLGDEAINLPNGVQGPFFNDDFEDVYFTLYSLTAPDWPQAKLVKEADKMQIALRQVQGVKKVSLIGEQAQRIYIDLDKQQLAQMGLAIQTVQQAINGQLAVTASGFIETSGPRLYLRSGQLASNRTDTVEQIKQLPITIGHQQVLLQDIAQVYRGYENPPSYLVRSKGEQALLLGVVMKPGVNGLELEKHLQQFEKQYQDFLPLGIQLDKVTNQADAIHSAVSTFELKFLTALFVVLIVSLITLGLRAGLIVSLAVPLTLAMTFMFMFIDGLNFDRITLGALIISLGLLVDDAIIAIEMMLVKMEEGMDKVKAAAYSWTVTAAPMLVGTLVTVVGFLPIGLANSRVGEYAGNIFWVLGITLIASWIVAVYFTPYLGVRILAVKGHASESNHAAKKDIYDTKTYRALRRLITACVRHKLWVVVFTVAVFVLAAIAMKTTVVKQFFPSSDRPELMVDIYLPEGTGINVTNAVSMRVEELINQYDEVKSLSAYVGRGAPRFFLALNPELTNPAFAKIIVVTHDKDARDALQQKLIAKINQGLFPEARVRVHPLLFGPPVVWPVTFRVVGPDPNELRRIANDLRVLIGQQDFAIDPHLQWGQRAPILNINMDKARLAQLGLTSQDVAEQLQTQLQNRPVAQVLEQIRTVNVVLRANQETRAKVGELGSILIKTPQGVALPLEQLGKIEVGYEDPILERRNRELYLSVNSEVVTGMQPPVATKIIQAKMQPIIDALPLGYRIDVGGSVEESSKAEASIQAMMPLMLLAMTLLIMLLVKSFSTLFMVMITAPLGLIGAVSAMLLFNQPFGFVANLGLIGLAGILMRNTLILTGQIDDNVRQGMVLGDAVIDATIRRARPVVLTAVAAMLAFIPLTTSTFWGPMAYVLIGGIGIGTILTLLFLPALYSLWFRVKLAH